VSDGERGVRVIGVAGVLAYALTALAAAGADSGVVAWP